MIAPQAEYMMVLEAISHTAKPFDTPGNRPQQSRLAVCDLRRTVSVVAIDWLASGHADAQK